MAQVRIEVAALTYGAGDFLGGIATKRTGDSLGVVAVWGAAAGIAGGAGVILFSRALATGVMSVVAPVAASRAPSCR